MDNVIKKQLASAFSEDCRLELSQSKKENGYVTHNSKSMAEWDIRFKRIIQVAEEYNLEYIIASRTALWEFVAIFDEKKMYLFSKEKNINTILDNYDSKPLHYVLCAVAINTHLDGLANIEQLRLLEDIWASDKEKIRKKLFGTIISDIEEVRVFSLEEYRKEPVRVEELLIDSNGQIVEVIDHSDAINADYTEIIQQEKVDKETMIVGLKPGVKKQQSVVDLKVKEEKDNKKIE